MSIGLSKINSGVDLIDYLDLRGRTFLSLNAESFLTRVWDVANRIWEDIDLIHYTNHNLKHSYKIIYYFKKLDLLYQWSDYEKLLFATASLIHDIGMQYNSWAPEGGDGIGFPIGPLEEDEIRTRHTDLLELLIRSQLDKRYAFQNPPDFCDIRLSGERSALGHALMIACAHNGVKTKYLNELQNRPENWRTRDLYGDSYRPRLLAMILRICDELDGNYDRILDREKMYSARVGSHSRAHWFSCLFIEETDINLIPSGDTYEVDIDLRWQIPEEAPEKQDLILDFLNKMRRTKISSEIQFARNFLFTCDEVALIRTFNLRPLNLTPATFSLHIDSNFDSILANVLQHKDPAPLVAGTKILEDLSSKNSTGLRASALAFESVPSVGTYAIPTFANRLTGAKLSDALVDWYIGNKIDGHFELINREEHTNVYLNCRTLASDQNLIRRLANEIFSSYSGEKIDCVLAVGTSAIPLAVNLAFMLQCASTFTVYREQRYETNIPHYIDTMQTAKADYNFVEVNPAVNEGDNLLIIDDVISGGSVAKVVLDNLEYWKKKPSKVFHHSVFRLGNRQYKEDPRIFSYKYLKHIEDVMYSTAEDCPLCHAGDDFVRESQM